MVVQQPMDKKPRPGLAQLTTYSNATDRMLCIANKPLPDESVCGNLFIHRLQQRTFREQKSAGEEGGGAEVAAWRGGSAVRHGGSFSFKEGYACLLGSLAGIGAGG